MGSGLSAASQRVAKDPASVYLLSALVAAACCVQELGPGAHPLPNKRTDMPHLSMFVMLYLEKKIPQPPPESCYINRIGIKWLFWLKKGMVPRKKVATQARYQVRVYSGKKAVDFGPR